MVIFTKKFGTLDPHLPIVCDKVPKKRFFYTFPYSTWKVLTTERYYLGREDRCLLLIENIPRVKDLVFTFLISLFITKKSRYIKWQLLSLINYKIRPTPSCLAVKKTEGRVGDQHPSVRFSVYELVTNIQDSRIVNIQILLIVVIQLFIDGDWWVSTSWRPRFKIYSSNCLDISWAARGWHQLVVVVNSSLELV